MAQPATDEQVRAVDDPSEVPPLAYETEWSIHQRMHAILSELPAIGKTQQNTQQNFMFRGHDDVLNALNPLLAKHGVYVVPRVVERVTGERTTGSNKTMYEVNLNVVFVFWGLNGDYIEASAWGEGTDMGDKATSKAMTMAFKTVLAQSFAVSTEEGYDPDAHSAEQTTRGAGRGGGSQARTRPQAQPQANVVRANSWAEWTLLMAENGVPAIDSAEWLRQAAEGTGIDTTSEDGKVELFRNANKALAKLAEHEGDLQFTVGARMVVRGAFAAGFGEEISGPPWRLDPEEDRPTFAEYQQARDLEEAEGGGERSSLDQVGPDAA